VRIKFLDAHKSSGAELQSYNHPLKGLDCGDLAMDLVYVGPTEVERVVEIDSAIHGAEGFRGSGCLFQTSTANCTVMFASAA